MAAADDSRVRVAGPSVISTLETHTPAQHVGTPLHGGDPLVSEQAEGGQDGED